jgi:hypothetical protein
MVKKEKPMSFEVGDKVWSPGWGDGKVVKVIDGEEFPVKVQYECLPLRLGLVRFTSDGYFPAEHKLPLLFHAGTYITPAPEPQRKPKEPEFKPFDRVLVRSDSGLKWVVSLFARSFIRIGKWTVYETINGNQYLHCIPYEGNEHLLGTSDEPGEKE